MSGPVGWRDQLATELNALLAATTIVAYAEPRLIRPVQGPIVVMSLTTVLPPIAACPVRRGAFELWVVTPMIDQTGAADQDVELALAAVLDALEQLRGVSWSSAARTLWLDGQPAFRINAERIPT
jgi:hypothetical protein